MSQVRNLRAMFESKGDSSPPDRGRSPGIASARKQVGGSSQDGSPRPLSKVRTNFVPVAKDRRVGSKRDNSGESSVSTRRPSPDVANSSRDNTDDGERNSTSSDDSRKTSTTEVPRQNTAELARGGKVAENVVDAAGTPETQLSREENTRLHDARARESCRLPDANGTRSENNSKFHTNADTNTSFSTATTTTGNTTRAKNTSSATSKSTVKEPKGPAIKPPDKKTLRHKQKVAATAAMGSGTRPKAAPASSEAPRSGPPIGTRPQSRNNVKPRPKSPTKPVSLPSSLVAPTASSVSKVHDPRPSHRNMSGNKSAVSTSSRYPAKPGSRPPSSIGHTKEWYSSASISRPSIGPPPSKNRPPTATSKKASNIDEGFLARMMRPTRSSASKLVDKAPVTVPRRPSQPCAEPKDSGSSDRASVRSVSSSRSSHAGKMASTELSGRSPRSKNKVVPVVEATEAKEQKPIDNDHEFEDEVVEVSEAAAKKPANEDAPEVANATWVSSESDQLGDNVKSSGRVFAPGVGPVSAPRDGEAESTPNGEYTMSEAQAPCTTPGRGESSAGDVDQEQPSDDLCPSEANVENIEVEEDLHEQTANTAQTMTEKPETAVAKGTGALSDTALPKSGDGDYRTRHDTSSPSPVKPHIDGQTAEEDNHAELL